MVNTTCHRSTFFSLHSVIIYLHSVPFYINPIKWRGGGVNCWSTRLFFFDFSGIHLVVKFLWFSWFWRAFEKIKQITQGWQKNVQNLFAQTSKSKIALLNVTKRQNYRTWKFQKAEITKCQIYKMSKVTKLEKL